MRSGSPSRSDVREHGERKRFGLPRLARLCRGRDFRRIYARGLRVRGDHLVIVACRRRAPGHRVGLSVSKEHGPAVRRNKIKRLLREAFRLERPGLPGRWDLILIPRQRDTKYSLPELRAELVHLVRELDRKPERRPDRKPGRRQDRRRRRRTDGRS